MPTKLAEKVSKSVAIESPPSASTASADPDRPKTATVAVAKRIVRPQFENFKKSLRPNSGEAIKPQPSIARGSDCAYRLKNKAVKASLKVP